MDCRRTVIALMVAAMGMPVITFAEGVAQLPTIDVQAEGESVTAPFSGLVAKESAAGTKSTQPLIKTPQSISVVPRRQLDEQAVGSVADALNYSSGVVTNYRGNSNRNDEVISRGYRYAPKVLDGLTFGLTTQGGGAGQLDPWLLERVEMVRGPAGVMFGQISPGGVVAMTSKRPTARTIHELRLGSGNQHLAEAALDLGGKLNADGSLLYRFNALASTRHEFIRDNRQERMAIAPALTWQPNENTSFTLLTSYQYDPRAGSRNFLPREGTLFTTSGGKVPYDFNVSEPSFDKAKRQQASIGYQLNHYFNDNVSFTQNLRYSHRNEDYKYLVYGVNSRLNDHTVTRLAQHESTLTNEFAVDNQLKVSLETGAVMHSLLAGLDYRYSHKNAKMYRDRNNDYLLDWLKPVHVHIDESDLTLISNDVKTLKQYGLYMQDQLTWGNWNLLLSGRYDWSRTSSDDRTAGGLERRFHDNKFTGRAGILYAFANGVSPYISYSTSFEPSMYQNAPGTPALKPNTGRQTEVGIKYQIPDRNTLLTASWFDITQRNLASYNYATSFYEQIGRVDSRGLELELRSNPLPELELVAAYTYTDMQTKESNNAREVGHRRPAIPRHAASLWGSYSFARGAVRGLTVGAGVRYTGVTAADAVGEYRVPHYTLYDAMLKYDLGLTTPALRGASLQLNLKNLTDKKYVASCSGKFACFYGSGRMIEAAFNYKW